MALAIGIVGLPNVGKSTLFTALTKKKIDIANYPFCTIEPNVGIVEVPDPRLTALAQKSASAKVIPTVIEFVDIAGLVKGASEGQGLGNKFLATIREVDAIAHVVRGFDSGDIIHVAGKVDPADDAAVINLELVLADLETVIKRLADLSKKAKSGGDRELAAQQATLTRLQAALEAGQLASTVALTDDEVKFVKTLTLLTTKPMIYVMNIDESQLGLSVSELASRLNIPGATVVPICAKLEAELAELSGEEKASYLVELGLKNSGLDNLVTAGYQILNLITFLTSGPQETRAWTVTAGSTAPQAAGKIHTDFEKGFIRAEVCNWQDFVEYGEVGCKERGLLRIEGKEYVMRDGDVCHFRFQ